MRHVGEEFGFRAVRRLGAGLLAGIFVGEVSEALGLLVGEEAFLLQVAHRYHQFALGHAQALFLELESCNVGSH